MRNCRNAHNTLLFYPYLGQDTGDAGRRIEWRGDYKADESVRELELWAICVIDWRLGRSVACVKSVLIKGVALINAQSNNSMDVKRKQRLS